MHSTYILFSPSLNRYYTGSTSLDVSDRLRRHNTNHKGFTGRANDWEIVYKQSFSDITEARSLEKSIKSARAKRFIARRKL